MMPPKNCRIGRLYLKNFEKLESKLVYNFARRFPQYAKFRQL